MMSERVMLTFIWSMYDLIAILSIKEGGRKQGCPTLRDIYSCFGAIASQGRLEKYTE